MLALKEGLKRKVQEHLTTRSNQANARKEESAGKGEIEVEPLPGAIALTE